MPNVINNLIGVTSGSLTGFR